MKKLFALIAFVAFFGAIASPAIAAAYTAPVAVKVLDDKPKKGESEKKSDCSAEKKAECAGEKKADCAGEKKACCESKK